MRATRSHESLMPTAPPGGRSWWQEMLKMSLLEGAWAKSLGNHDSEVLA